MNLCTSFHKSLIHNLTPFWPNCQLLSFSWAHQKCVAKNTVVNSARWPWLPTICDSSIMDVDVHVHVNLGFWTTTGIPRTTCTRCGRWEMTETSRSTSPTAIWRCSWTHATTTGNTWEITMTTTTKAIGHYRCVSQASHSTVLVYFVMTMVYGMIHRWKRVWNVTNSKRYNWLHELAVQPPFTKQTGHYRVQKLQ